MVFPVFAVYRKNSHQPRARIQIFASSINFACIRTSRERVPMPGDPQPPPSDNTLGLPRSSADSSPVPPSAAPATGEQAAYHGGTLLTGGSTVVQRPERAAALNIPGYE